MTDLPSRNGPDLAIKARLKGSLLAVTVTMALGAASMALAAPPTIVLVGGMKQGMVDAEHDFPDGILKLERIIRASPDFASIKPTLKVYPVGFPKNLAEIDDASVVVLYTGPHRVGDRNDSPVQDPAVQQALDRLMDRGAGLVALHQAFTVPDKTSGASFAEWLGGYRVAVTDYTFETAPLTVAAKGSPIVNGVGAFNYLDEFYPTVELTGGSKITPVLTAKIHVQQTRAGPVFQEPSSSRVVAWAYERPGGGRSFAYSGGHYLASLDQPQVRTMLLNAILWAAHSDVPQAGATSALPVLQVGRYSPATVEQRVVLPIGEVKAEPQPWGVLQWFASRALGNSANMTVGQATIRPGQANPPHWHPNCDEILHVIQGHIMHRVGDKEYEMWAGDTVVIPEGTVHNARNIGKEDAILAVSFNSADRVAIGE